MVPVIACAAALCCTALVIPTASPAAEPAPVLAQGFIFDDSGSPVADAAVRVSAVPVAPIDGISLPAELGHAQTAADGSYEVRGYLPKSSGEYTNASREVELEVEATYDTFAIVGSRAVPVDQLVSASTTGQRASRARQSSVAAMVMSLEHGEGEVSAPAQHDARVQTSSTSLVVVNETTDSGDGTGVSPGVDATDPDGTGSPDTLPGYTLSADRGSATACAYGYQYAWMNNLVYKRSYVPIARVTTRQDSKQSYTYETTNQTKLSIGYSGSDGSSKGALTASYESDSTLGKKLALGHGSSKMMKLQWQYQRGSKLCFNEYTGDSYYVNAYKWHPDKLTGGDALPVESTPPWDCGPSTTTQMHLDTWIAKSSSVNYMGYFEIAGAKLDASTKNNDSTQLYIDITSTRGARVCGDSDFPPNANRVKERTQ